MEAITSWLDANAGGADLVWLLLAIGGAVCLFAYGISLFVAGATDPVRRRRRGSDIGAGRGVARARPRLARRPAGELRHAESFRGARFHANASRPGGVPHAAGTAQLLRHETLLAIALPLAVLVAARWLPQLTTNMIGFCCVLAALIGVRLPDLVLEHVRQRRIKRLRNGLPDALDLLVVCVESGLGLAPAIERVARELEFSHPDLGQELSLVNAEMRAGVERPVALRNLAYRTGVDDINGLVGLLVQTIRFGTSVAEALRVYSEEFRDKRMQKAEEQAAKIGTKMIFPLVLCLFPSFFIVAIGPAVLRIIAVFKQM